MKFVPLLLLAGCVARSDRAADDARLHAESLMARFAAEGGGNRELLAEGASAWVQVAAGNSDLDSRLVAARELSGIVRLKLARPELRQCAFDSRRFLLEALVELERYAVDRTPRSRRSGAMLAAALRDLAAELNAQAVGANRRVAAAWQARALDLMDEARTAAETPDRFSASLETARFVERGPGELLGEAGSAAVHANQEICGETPSPKTVIAALDAGFRHWVYVIETTSPADARAVMAAEFWQRRFEEWRVKT